MVDEEMGVGGKGGGGARVVRGGWRLAEGWGNRGRMSGVGK